MNLLKNKLKTIVTNILEKSMHIVGGCPLIHIVKLSRPRTIERRNENEQIIKSTK